MRTLMQDRPRITCRVWNKRTILLKKQRLALDREAAKTIGNDRLFWTVVKNK